LKGKKNERYSYNRKREADVLTYLVDPELFIDRVSPEKETFVCVCVCVWNGDRNSSFIARSCFCTFSVSQGIFWETNVAFSICHSQLMSWGLTMPAFHKLMQSKMA